MASAPERYDTRQPISSPAGAEALDLQSDKLYFKIGEVSHIVGVAPHVLRYWESEFRTVKPAKSRSQQRVYRRRDVEILLKIKHLLYDQKFTIAGARKQLREKSERCAVAPPDGTYLARQSLAKVRTLLDDSLSFCEAWATVDRGAADPAALVADVGGPQALVEPLDSRPTVTPSERGIRRQA